MSLHPFAPSPNIRSNVADAQGKPPCTRPRKKYYMPQHPRCWLLVLPAPAAHLHNLQAGVEVVAQLPVREVEALDPDLTVELETQAGGTEVGQLRHMALERFALCHRADVVDVPLALWAEGRLEADRFHFRIHSEDGLADEPRLWVHELHPDALCGPLAELGHQLFQPLLSRPLVLPVALGGHGRVGRQGGGVYGILLPVPGHGRRGHRRTAPPGSAAALVRSSLRREGGGAGAQRGARPPRGPRARRT
mmetsp:Transcript_14263/g.40555  ORF Transcript_14263/g.40555 Transcript_14263/m.40555 type:complete len:249 (+) Transcript_14263:83-829(+)